MFVRPAARSLTLLMRMQQNKTNKYVYYSVYFLLYLLVINTDGLTPDYVIQTVDEIESGYCNLPTLISVVLTRRRTNRGHKSRQSWSCCKLRN